MKFMTLLIINDSVPAPSQVERKNAYKRSIQPTWSFCMNKAMRSLIQATAALVVLTLSGCATVISGTTQTLTFNSEPKGADVYLDGARVGTTPVSLSVKKNKKDAFMIQKEGYKTVSRDITKSYDPVTVLSIFWDYSTTDMISGAAFEYEPNSYFVELAKDEETNAVN
jgi:uncharacterized protein YceK